MKKLTDADVARALGWTQIEDRYWCLVQHPEGLSGKHILFRELPKNREPGYCIDFLPPFTTSLDAIVAEVEDRSTVYGDWHLDRCTPGERTGNPRFYKARVGEFEARADTAPLALCHALLAYLEDTRKPAPHGDGGKQ